MKWNESNYFGTLKARYVGKSLFDYSNSSAIWAAFNIRFEWNWKASSVKRGELLNKQNGSYSWFIRTNESIPNIETSLLAFESFAHLELKKDKLFMGFGWKSDFYSTFQCLNLGIQFNTRIHTVFFSTHITEKRSFHSVNLCFWMKIKIDKFSSISLLIFPSVTFTNDL